jgi:nicotinamidase-related amidase
MVLVLIFTMLTKSFAQAAENPLDNKLLVVLDVQEYTTKYLLPDSTAEHFINKVNNIIEKANPENVIYIKAIHRTLNLSLSKIYIDTLPHMDLYERLIIVNQRIFCKTKANAFSSDQLSDFVKKTGIKEIVVIGLMAEHCGIKTLLGGKDLGYKMYYVSEALLGESEVSKSKILNKLRKKGISELSL